MSTKKTPPEPIVVPSLRDVSPEYGALLDRQVELLGKREKLEKEMRSIRRGKAPAALVADVSERRRIRTAELLGDLVEGADDVVVSPKRDEVEEHLATMRDECEAVEAALAVIAKRLPSVKSAASRLACQQIQEPYRAVVRRLVDAMLSAYAAHAELSAVRDDMFINDIAFDALPTPVVTPMLGHFLERDTRFARWVRDAVATGYLDWANVPERLK